MTVRELIEKLSTQSPDMEVYVRHDDSEYGYISFDDPQVVTDTVAYDKNWGGLQPSTLTPKAKEIVVLY